MLTSCAVQLADSESKILGGEAAAADQFPFAAFMTVRGGLGCSAALAVDKRTVITAAHCLTGGLPMDAYKVVVGEISRTNGQAKRYDVEQIAIHPAYQAKARGGCGIDHEFNHDLAILRLSEEVEGGEPIQLTAETVAPESDVTAVGWGAFDDTMQVSETLQHATFALLAPEPGVEGLRYQGEGQATCPGDSGGPLVARKADEWVLVGVHTHGLGLGCAPNKRSGAVDVHAHSTWITETLEAMKQNGSDIWFGDAHCFDPTERPDRLRLNGGIRDMRSVGTESVYQTVYYPKGYSYAHVDSGTIDGELIFRSKEAVNLSDLQIKITRSDFGGGSTVATSMVVLRHYQVGNRMKVEFSESSLANLFTWSSFWGKDLGADWSVEIRDPQGRGLELVQASIHVWLEDGGLAPCREAACGDAPQPNCGTNVPFSLWCERSADDNSCGWQTKCRPEHAQARSCSQPSDCGNLPGMECCSGTCVNVKVSKLNCGRCGSECTNGTCSGGACLQ